MIKRLIEGIKSLTINGNPVKWIGLSIPVGTMIYVKSVDSPVSFFVFYLAIPTYLYVLGMANGEEPNKKKVNNEAQYTNYNSYSPQNPQNNDNMPMQENYNNSTAIQIVDRVERKTITSSKQEEIETIYFKNGVPADIRKEMNYFD